MTNKLDEMLIMYKTHISDGEELLNILEETMYNSVRGIHKLQRKIRKDIKFLLETSQSNNMKKEHLVCTNLHFYKAVVQEMLNQSECDAVLETFSYKTEDGCQKRLTVDVISRKGQRWTKVIARNPVALDHIYREGDNFGRRSILDQAMSYVEAASQNLHMYSPPKVVFSFVNGVPGEMKNFLERQGILVEGTIISLENHATSSCSTDSDSERDDFTFTGVYDTLVPVKQNLSRINLCVTTMIAFVSSLTNGGCGHKFKEPLLAQQAEWEKVRPVKPFLDNLLKDKELICCATAVEDFKSIVDMVGGEEEKCRAAALLSSIIIVPDVSFADLKPSGKIKKRSLLIFGTGHAHKAITVTANKGFVHASKQKGVKFAVVIHESRALSERKQLPENCDGLLNNL